MSSTPYTDPRLAALYDALNPEGPDTAFYRALAARTGARSRIVDLGCGTGLLTCALAGDGHHVIGIDPSRDMLRIARKRDHGDHVQWIEGDATALAVLPPADLLLMTGHVAQIFLDDAAFLATLAAARHALRGGGRLAFESRDPAAQAWEDWTRDRSRRLIRDADGQSVEVWQERLFGPTDDGRVAFDTHYRFESTGERVSAESELRFRSQPELAALLVRAGFGELQWHDGWDDVSPGRELIVVAG